MLTSKFANSITRSDIVSLFCLKLSRQNTRLYLFDSRGNNGGFSHFSWNYAGRSMELCRLVPSCLSLPLRMDGQNFRASKPPIEDSSVGKGRAAQKWHGQSVHDSKLFNEWLNFLSLRRRETQGTKRLQALSELNYKSRMKVAHTRKQIVNYWFALKELTLLCICRESEQYNILFQKLNETQADDNFGQNARGSESKIVKWFNRAQTLFQSCHFSTPTKIRFYMC